MSLVIEGHLAQSSSPDHADCRSFSQSAGRNPLGAQIHNAPRTQVAQQELFSKGRLLHYDTACQHDLQVLKHNMSPPKNDGILPKLLQRQLAAGGVFQEL